MIFYYKGTHKLSVFYVPINYLPTLFLPGDFYTTNNGSQIAANIFDFVYDVYPSNYAPTVSYMYYLWGEWDDSAGTHQGVDMNHPSANPIIKTAHAGTVTVVDRDGLGVVGIYNSSTNKTYFYAHLAGITVAENGTVSPGVIIGYEGNTGVGTAHLLFEVRNGRSTGLASNSNQAINTIKPYTYMGS